MNQIKLYSKTSMNTIDRYSIYNTFTNNYQHNNLFYYILLECDFQKSWINSSFDTDGILEHDYQWKFSVWNTLTSRLSCESFINISSKTNLDIDFIYAIEFIPTMETTLDSGKYYIYLDLIHRATGIPVASGSCDITELCFIKHSKKNTLQRHILGMKNITIDLITNQNIKNWNIIRQYPNHSKNVKNSLQFCCTLGSLITTERIANHQITTISNNKSTLDFLYFNDRTHSILPKMIKIIPSSKPTMFRYLQISNQLRQLEIEQEGYNSNLIFANNTSTTSSMYMEDDILQSFIEPQLTGHEHAWLCHVSISDVQLTSDILDLYMDRNIIITGGCGNISALTSQTYLGNISKYVGSFVEKAEIIHPIIHNFESIENKIYRSCVHFEVKIVEEHKIANNSIDFDAPFEHKATSFNTFILCHGLIIESKAANLTDEHVMNASSNNDNEEDDDMHSLERTAVPIHPLTSGNYEVLLYSLPNNELDLEERIVGKAYVRIDIEGNHIFRKTRNDLILKSISLKEEFHQNVYEEVPIIGLNQNQVTSTLSSFLLLLQFLIYNIDGINKLSTLNKQLSLKQTQDPLQLQNLMNDTIIIHNQQKAKLFDRLTIIFNKLNHITDMDSHFMSECLFYMCDNVINIIPGSTPKHVSDKTLQRYSVMHSLQSYFQHWLTSDVLKELIEKSSIQVRPSLNLHLSPQEHATKIYSSLTMENRQYKTYWDSITSLCFCIKLMVILYDRDNFNNDDNNNSSNSNNNINQSPNKNYLEHIICREFLNDQSTLIEISEDLIVYVFNYLNNITLNAIDLLRNSTSEDVSKSQQIQIDSIHTIYEGLHSIYTLISILSLLQHKGQESISTFIESFVQFVLYIGNHNHHELDFCVNELVTILIKLCSITVKYIHPSGIRKFGTLKYISIETHVFTKSLDSLTIAMQYLSRKIFLLNNTSLDNSLLILTMTKCITTLCSKFTNMLETFNKTIKSSEVKLTEYYNQSISLDNNMKYVNSPRIAGRTITHHRSEEGKYINNNMYKEETTEEVVGDIIPSPYSGDIVLQVFYENRFYLNCIQQLLQSLHLLQIPFPLISDTTTTFNESIHSMNEFTFNTTTNTSSESVGLIASSIAIHDLVDTTLNSICKGTLSISNFSSYVFTHADKFLSCTNHNNSVNIMYFQSYICRLQGISLSVLEKSMNSDSIKNLNADQHLDKYKASINQIESILLCQNNYTLLLQHLLHSDPLLNVESFEKFSIGSCKEAMKRTTIHTYLSDAILCSTSYLYDFSQDKLYYINTIEMWYYFYHSVLNTLQGICMYIIHLHVSYKYHVTKISVAFDHSQENKLYQLFEEAVNLMCKTMLMADIVLDRKDVRAITLNKPYLYESMLPIVSNIFILMIKTPDSLFENIDYYSSYQHKIITTLVRLVKGHIDAMNVFEQSFKVSKTYDLLLNFIIMILEELFKLSISDQMKQHKKSILLNSLHKYLLSAKISSNIGIEFEQTNTQQKKRCIDFFRIFLDALITDENNVLNGSYQAISYFNSEYALHLTAVIHYLSMNCLFTDHKKDQDIIAKKLPKVLIHIENSIQTECNELIMSSTLSQNIIYIYQYILLNNEKDVHVHLTLMIEELSKIFNKYQKCDKYTTMLHSISNVHSKTSIYENVESNIIKYLGFSNKAYLNILKLLLHHQDAQLRQRNHLIDHSNEIIILSQEYLEIELDYLRICLQTLLSSGFWEVGINLSNVYLNKYKSMINNNHNNMFQNLTVKSLPSSPYSSPTRSIIHSPSNNNNNNDTCNSKFHDGFHSPGSSCLSKHHPSSQRSDSGVTMNTPVTRQESVKAELLRMIDQFQTKIQHDGVLRTFGQFYAIRFVTNTSWYCNLSSELDRNTMDILNSIPNYNCKYMTSMIETPSTNEKHPHHYEYWLVLHFDSASYRNCAEYYEQIVLEEEQKSKEFQYKECNSKDSNFYNLSSPITYHSISNVITQAFPDYLLLSSHHVIDDYFKDTSSSSECYEPNMKFMQVFQAFPSILCDQVHDDNFIDIIDPIEVEEEEIQVSAINNVLTSSININEKEHEAMNDDNNNVSDEKKESTVDIKKVNRLDELLCSYQPMLLHTQYTKFYAYAIMNEDECIARQHKDYISTASNTNTHSLSSSSIPMVSGDAYINRFELITTQGKIDYSQLGILSLNKQQPEQTTTSTTTTTKLHHTDNTISNSNNNNMNVFSLNPINIAINQCNVMKTITDSSLEIMFYYTILLHKSLKALQKLNEFTKNDLLNEPTNDITNSASVFMGIFTLLCNILETPNATCINLSYMESIIISEQERLEVEWQIFRKNLKRNYMRELLAYDTKIAAINNNAHNISKSKLDHILKSILKPIEPDFNKLKEEYDTSEKHNHVYILHKLYTNIEILIINIIHEMRTLTNSKNYELTNSGEEEFHTKSKNYIIPFIEPTNENQYTIQLKLCLYLETLYYAREISTVI